MILYFTRGPFRGQKISATVTYALLDWRACTLGNERLTSKKKKKTSTWDTERLLHREQTFKNAVLILKIFTGSHHGGVGAWVVCTEMGFYFTADSSPPQLCKGSLSSSVPLLHSQRGVSHQPREQTEPSHRYLVINIVITERHKLLCFRDWSACCGSVPLFKDHATATQSWPSWYLSDKNWSVTGVCPHNGTKQGAWSYSYTLYSVFKYGNKCLWLTTNDAQPTQNRIFTTIFLCWLQEH